MTTTNTSRPASGTKPRLNMPIGRWVEITRADYWTLRRTHCGQLTIWASHTTPGVDRYTAEALRDASMPLLSRRFRLTGQRVAVEYRRYQTDTTPLATAGSSASWHGGHR